MIIPIAIVVLLLVVLAVLLVLRIVRLPVFLILAGLVAVVGTLVLVKMSQIKAMMAMQYSPPADTVTTAAVVETAWQPFLS